MHQKRLVLKATGEAGEVAADIATLDVVDHDRDVTEKGFFGEQPVSIVSGHDWGDIMLGKGLISDADGEKARFKGRFNLDDPDAKKLYSKVKFDMETPPPLIEWSYGFDILKGGSKAGVFQEQDVQILQPLPDGSPGSRVFEVSPVMAGAGVGTGTTGVKSRRFKDQLSEVTWAVDDAIARAEAVAALRANDGKSLSDDAQRQLSELAEKLTVLTAKVRDGLLAETESEEEKDGALTEELLMLEAQFTSYRL